MKSLTYLIFLPLLVALIIIPGITATEDFFFNTSVATPSGTYCTLGKDAAIDLYGYGFNQTVTQNFTAKWVLISLKKVGSSTVMIYFAIFNTSVGVLDNTKNTCNSTTILDSSTLTTSFAEYNFTLPNCELHTEVDYGFSVQASTVGSSSDYGWWACVSTGLTNVFNQKATSPVWEGALSGRGDIAIYGDNSTGGGGGGTATITLDTGSTSAGTYNNESTNSITGVSKVNDYNPTNTTIYLYNGTSTTRTSNTTSPNFTATFTNLPVGNYTLNASSTNGTSTIEATARNIIIYGTSTTINTPINKENITRSLNISYTDTITPSGVAYISTHNISVLNSDGSLNFTVNASTNTTPINYDLYNKNLIIGNYTVQIKTRDNYTYNRTFTKDFILTRDAELNITLKYVIGNATLNNYTLNITDESTGNKETYTTANNTTTIYIIKGRNYTVTIDKIGYSISNYTGLSFTNNYNNYTFYIYTENSVLINIYDESDLTIVNDSTVSITFSNNVSALSYITTNGTYYKDGLSDGVWEVKFYSANYSYRTYFITVYNRSFQTLDAYLVPSAFTCVFTIRDSLTLAPLEDTSFSVERLSNSTYIVVESKVSDIGGNVQIGFLPGIEYRFTLTKSGYTSKVFSLNPIIFNAYNIYLDKTASLNNTLDYGNVNIALYPKTFYNNRANGITFTITSPEGVLTNYRISIKAPGGSNSTTGSNAIGETFTINFNITNATIYDRVNITYNYTSTMGGIKIYRFQYEIIGAGNVGNYTIANLKNREYGMGTFEKVLLVMIGMVIIVGFAFMLTGTAGALVIGLICLNVSVYLGFLPYWSVIIPDILGIIIIIAVSTGGRQ